MTKIISLELNNDFGVLKAQKAEFKETSDGLIEIKAGVGEGKTTLKQAAELAISAGNTQTLPFDTEKLKDVDVEIELSTGVFMRTYSDAKGKLKSVAYRKLEDGKIDKDPVINGKKLTPAVLRDLIRTELTFGIDDFLSEEKQVEFIEDLTKNKPIQPSTKIVKSELEDLKTEIKDILDEINNPPPPPKSEGPARIYLLCMIMPIWKASNPLTIVFSTKVLKY